MNKIQKSILDVLKHIGFDSEKDFYSVYGAEITINYTQRDDQYGKFIW
jgi:hypothetical protein